MPEKPIPCPLVPVECLWNDVLSNQVVLNFLPLRHATLVPSLPHSMVIDLFSGVFLISFRPCQSFLRLLVLNKFFPARFYLLIRSSEIRSLVFLRYALLAIEAE